MSVLEISDKRKQVLIEEGLADWQDQQEAMSSEVPLEDALGAMIKSSVPSLKKQFREFQRNLTQKQLRPVARSRH